MTQADSAQTGASLTIDQAPQLISNGVSRQATTLNSSEFKSLRALFRAGQYAEAVSIAQALTERFPEQNFGWMALATALNRLGRVVEALGPMQKAVALSPDDAEAHSNLGAMFKSLDRLDEAEVAYRRALQIRPDFAEVHFNLGNTLQSKGELPESVLAYRQALLLKPDFPDAHFNLANSLKDLGRLDEAEASYHSALRIRPEFAEPQFNLLFALNYHPDKSGEEVFAAYRHYEQQFGQPHRAAWRTHTNDRTLGRRLKVGYVSPALRQHSSRHFLEPLLAQHDHSVVEVYAYAELAREDAVTDRYQSYVDHWVPTQGLSDEALAQRIRDDGIDILVDVAGHTAGNRLQVFARKPAPVSLHWLDFGYTTGLSAIDYYLTDWPTVPAGSEALFSEEPWRLNGPGLVYRPAEGMGEAGPLPAADKGHLTFGSLTRAVRINHHTVRVWAELLKQVPQARLVINSGDYRTTAMQDELAKRFEAHGITRGRLDIGHHSPPWDVLRQIDIGLDCFPHNSGTTLFESLYLGVPFVTLAGRPSVGRMGSAILEGVGHPEWIAHTEAQYVEIAANLAADLPKLASTRAGLRAEMQASPLMDEAGFARRVEAAYIQMFARWVGQSVDHLLGGAELAATHADTTQASVDEAVPSVADFKALVTLFANGQYEEAATLAKPLTQRFPSHAFGWKMLAAAFSRMGQHAEALETMQKALALSPEDAEAHNNLGAVLKALGRLDEAQTSYRRALQIKPDYAEAHFNLGSALQTAGRMADAQASYRQALGIDPNHARACQNLGVVLKELDRLDEAEVIYRRALQLSPSSAITHTNLGNTLHALGRFDEAEASYGQALQLDPDYADAHYNLGYALQATRRVDEAAASYRRALRIRPGFSEAYGNLLFVLNYHPDMSGEAIFNAYRDFDFQFGLPWRRQWRKHTNDGATHRRLKVGYVSSAFWLHSCRHFLEPLLARHDRSVVEVYAYAQQRREDAVTARYKTCVDHWVPTEDLTDEDLAERIRADGIDVLVDVAGHTTGNRLPVFARKPAPVSLHWLDFGYTTGLSAIDYYLADWQTVPQGSEALFSESPWRLEGSCLVYRPAEGMGEVSPLPAAGKGSVTFGSLTRSVRINHRTIRVWSEILRRVPGSCLVVDSGDFRSAKMCDLLAKEFFDRGVSRDRLRIGCHSPPWDVLRAIDISLDCFPHNSGTTLFESLYLGVPFVTLAGRPSVGRIGSAILQGLGHPEWIAQNEDEYIDTAVALATDLLRLANLRAGLRAEMQHSELMDEAGFARRVEAAYRGMFERWVTEQNSGVTSSLVEAPPTPTTNTCAPVAQANPSASDIQALVDLFTQGRYAEVVVLAKLLTQRLPRHEFGWKMLAAALHQLGRFADALAPMQEAAALSPGDAEAHNNVGATLKALGRLDEAQASYHRALQIRPDYAEAHFNQGNVLQTLGRFGEAEVSYQRALQIRPDYAEAHSNLGAILKNLGQLVVAESSYRRAIEILPDYADAHFNLGNILRDLGRLDEAELSYRRAVQIMPAFEDAHSNLLFALNYHADRRVDQVLAAYRAYDEQFGLPHRSQWRPHGNTQETQRRLKVGYVSPALRRHSSRHFLEPLLAHHDESVVEIYAYAEISREDEVTDRYKSYVDHWVPTLGMSDDALAERIRLDNIDILVELAGHTVGNRLQVFARKPAPVSLHWLDFGYTTGLRSIDYYLTDWPTVPEGGETMFSEMPWRLDGPGLVYRPAEGMGAVSPLPAAQAGHVTFGTLTRAVRINNHTVRVWSEILRRVPGSRLVIDSGDHRSAAMRAVLEQRFAGHGISPARLVIGYHSPPWDVLRAIDISLDCFPHNSGTTLFESLYMGVPFVTLAGRPSVGRMGCSILQGVGHPELIAHNEDQYVETAVSLAGDLPKLAALRAGLRAEMQHSLLMDEVGFARRVEAAYRGMFGRWVAGQDGDKATSPVDRPVSPATNTDAHVDQANPSAADIQALVALFSSGRYAEAATLAKPLTQRFPHHEFAWKMLAAVLSRMGRHADALEPMQQAAALSPGDAEAHSNLGATFKALDRLPEAQASYQRALQIKPDYAQAHYNLGNTLQALGQLEQAEVSYRHALTLTPDYAPAHFNLGNALKAQGRLDEAEQSYVQAVRIKPDHAQAWCNLGATLQALGRLHDARASYHRAVQIKPDYADAHSNMGNTLGDLGRLDDAQASYQCALHIKPDHAEAHSNLLFALNYHPDKGGEEVLAAYRSYEQHFGQPHRAAWRAHDNDRSHGRRLKIGYVSPALRQHSSRHFLEPLLAQHDHSVVEVYAYAELAREDAVTARYKSYVDHWLPTQGLSDETLAQRIRDDGIDILVDVAGHTAGNRLQVFARKPAPVSLHWLDFGYTTGLSAIDYYLTDWPTVPAGSEALFSETPWRLDGPGLVYRPAEGMGEAGPSPAQQKGHLTFGSLTRAVRINHHTVRAWAELLKQLPTARLVINSGDYRTTAMQDELAKRFEAHGITRERLDIGHHSPPWDVLRQIDIGLDCFPHNSGTTLFENLYLGVPFVTLAGRPSVGRMGSAILQGLGHPEWIANTEAQYVEIATAMAADLPKLATLRASLRAEMQACPLMDEAGFARRVEGGYRQMFENWAQAKV